MADRLHLKQRHRQTLEALLREHLPGVEVWAYGSRVNGKSHDGSDLDLVLRGPGLEKTAPGQLGDFEEAVRKSSIPFLVEARDWAYLPTRFHREIERDYVMLVEGEEKSSGVKVEWLNLPFSKAVSVNPSVRLERGKIYPFVDMAAINVGCRSVYAAQFRQFQGGGARFQTGDILMARITPCLENGKIARYCSSDATEAAHGSTELIVIRGRPSTTNTEYAYYLTRWEKVRNYAVGKMTGTSGRQRVPVDSLDHLIVPVPSLPEQRAIAHILGTLDDKIELNRRMNETLEAMARALFKSWFVDFDPVRAKMEGRDTGLPKHVADLFPDRFVASELGEIPEGWAVKPLGECFNLTMGQSPPGSSYNNLGKGSPFFQGRTDFGFRYPENRKFCTAPARKARPGDTLVSVRAPVGDINMAWAQCCIGRGVATLRHKSASSSYTYYSVQAMQKTLSLYEQTGTVFGSINKKQFESLQTIEPRLELIKGFDTFVGPLDSNIEQNTARTRTLINLRDLLLPKLISGEIRFHGVKKSVRSW